VTVDTALAHAEVYCGAETGTHAETASIYVHVAVASSL
jgi:hypothetical protein